MAIAITIALLVGGVVGYLISHASASSPAGRMIQAAHGTDTTNWHGTDTTNSHGTDATGSDARVERTGLATALYAGDDDVVVDGEQADASVDDVGFVLRLAVTELQLGVVVCATDGKIIYRNRAASALTGTHAGVIVEEHVDAALSMARDGIHADEIVELHGPPRRSLELRVAPMSNGLAVATIEDVSERARLDAMRTDFVANISHELKTPVGAVAVLAETLDGETDRQVVDRVAERIVEEAHRAVRSIDDLLELARIEGATSTTDVVDLTDIVEEAITRGRAVDADHGVTVTAFDTRPPIRLRADRRQLVSALGNLVENAVKYSDPDGVVQVRTRATDRVIEVMVADQGDGIPARDLDRVFERFYRVDRARSRTTGGSGLGLSIVRHVASNHGGEVAVSSTEGEGSTFVLRLPASLVVQSEPGLGRTEGQVPKHMKQNEENRI